ncbi:MAG TPA: RidA family protein [Chryseolinea sp.]|nr:RidA family protein [Chryseolinea sp.]HPH47393.1 RidA family protein [Chryseolinea sp.]HPM31193.1 RidA family protein [Chryseolinea sp.]
MEYTYINPKSLFNSTQYGFSQMVVSNASAKLFYTSGQVAIDAEEKIVANDLAGQTREVLLNLIAALNEAGGNLKDIMMLRIYFVNKGDFKNEEIGIVLREFFGTENPPASSWIGVHSLARPEFLIEIEASGVLS